MNLDFGTDPLFSWYVVLLCLSGVGMIAISAIRSSGQSTGVRAFNALVGVGFLGYGAYLGFIFQGGTYLIFFKAFILPAILLVNFFRSLASQRRAIPAQQQYTGQQSSVQQSSVQQHPQQQSGPPQQPPTGQQPPPQPM